MKQNICELFLFSGGNHGELFPKLYSSFKYLVVMDMSGSSLVNMGESIGCLYCLCFLDLSHRPIRTLPLAIEDLLYKH